VRHPDKLGHIGRLDIICRVRELLFLDPATVDWNYDLAYDDPGHRSLLFNHIKDIFCEYGLAPDHSYRGYCPCSTCVDQRITNEVSELSLTERGATSEPVPDVQSEPNTDSG